MDTMNMKASEVVNLQDLHLFGKQTKLSDGGSATPGNSTSGSAVKEDSVINVELEKAADDSLGFALVGGRNGWAILIKAIRPGSAADLDRRLQVGDILLKRVGTEQPTLCTGASTELKPERRWMESPLRPKLLLAQHSSPDEAVRPRSPPKLFTRRGRDTNSRNNSLLQDHKPQREENSENISNSLQTYSLKTQKRQETAESDGCMSDEDEGIAQRLSALPRGLVLVSEEELTQLAQLQPSLSKGTLRYNAENLIQKLQRQIEQQEVLTEFMSLEHMKPRDDCWVAKAPENREKNRYRDILPYDATRVPLGEVKGYINASYIRVPVGKGELFYISTQGPLPCTTHDFWQMVWENRSNVIAMITKEVEHGISKCHRYWPEPPNSSVDVIQFHLRLVNYQILDGFIIRMIEIMNKQTQERRIMQHLQFTSWPDHSTPTSSEHLLRFVRYMRKIHQSGPIITHCSAGIGRSGVLLCVDILLNCIERDLFFDIKQIVTHLRHQRFGMIQTKEQYMFCYEIALEILKKIQSMNSQPLQ